MIDATLSEYGTIALTASRTLHEHIAAVCGHGSTAHLRRTKLRAMLLDLENGNFMPRFVAWLATRPEDPLDYPAYFGWAIRQ